MARSHKEFRHVFAGQQPVTDLGGGNVHYRGVDDLDVVGAEKGLFKASHSVRGNFFGIKYIRCGKILALLDQPMPDAIHIVPLVRVDRHSIFGKYSREIPPAADALEVVRAYDKSEIVVRLALLQRVQSSDCVVRRIHLEFDVVHPDVQFRVTFDGGHGSLITAFTGIRAYGILQGVLRRHNEVNPVIFLLPCQVLHYGLMADVQGIERPRINGSLH